MEILPLFIPCIVSKLHIYKANVRTCNIHNNTVTSHVLRTAQRPIHNSGKRSIMDQEHDEMFVWTAQPAAIHHSICSGFLTTFYETLHFLFSCRHHYDITCIAISMYYYTTEISKYWCIGWPMAECSSKHKNVLLCILDMHVLVL